ncbi:MAG: ribosome small subunit-dependent GTPase A [Proteobacteria bacterium]|nr:ribosome small subunit-dependent GTPase A [Pseudomonadota bacterium]MBU1389096.1 ribosome small subunit-dependent GTPase A [Pseudomonadota bacterium]MBU1543649.1 ribosome small subunit-dependent GTPase A [Pseudomonadota bacterium]MBU2479853.1 ribosome small subunit-dependent GTPase A [Pseudomonadota bacterium]
MSNTLNTLGFDQWFQDRVLPEKMQGFDIARVVAVHKDSYVITSGKKDVFAELIGKMIYNAVSALDYPAVGDWVLAKFYDDSTFSIIHEIVQRKSLLKRKTSGKKVDFQIIAANIDVAFIVQSLDDNFNLRRLERYLVIINESNIRPVFLLSKSDLFPPEKIAACIQSIHQIMPHLQVYPFSNENKSGLKIIEALLTPNLTYCLLGSSGVGKTSLLNNLMGQSVFKTAPVREKDSKGRHATTSRQLTVLANGAMVIDTPGMRELGNFSMDTGIEETFCEITALSEKCLFNDCTHVSEKGCAILLAVEEGRLSADRYHNYIKMNKEAAYNEMSYLEKKKKDKQFGKQCKAVMRQNHGKYSNLR